jgi:1,4-alpha-glucan branching enzyme
MAESKVRFTLRAPKASSVVVVGDFNGWSKSSTPLTDEDGDGIWTVSVPLEPGIYQYNFLVDGKEWRSDPAADGRRRDGFGGYNSVLRI